ncbi:hypothetical protein [Petrachloros mirabilis]
MTMDRDSQNPGSMYGGMTVNERLFAAGLFDAFDDAVYKKDRDKMLELLQQVAVEKPEWSVDMILAHPERYGF